MTADREHFSNEEIYEWIKIHSQYNYLKHPENTFELMSWMEAKEKANEAPKVPWSTFCHVVATLGDRHKWEKFEVYHVDGTNRRLKKLLEWTIALDREFSKLSKDIDVQQFMETQQGKYPIIEAFGLDQMITVVDKNTR